MIKTTFALIGYEQVQRRLRSLEKNAAKKIQRKAMRAGAKPIQKEAKKQAPKRSGLLRKSIKVRAGKRKRNRIVINVQTRAGDFKGETYYASFLVYGSRRIRTVWEGKGKDRKRVKKVVGNQPPDNFFERAFRAKKGEARSIIVAELRRLIREEMKK